MPSDTPFLRICPRGAASGALIAALGMTLAACGSAASGHQAAAPAAASASAGASNAAASGPAVPGTGTIALPAGSAAASDGSGLPADAAKAASQFVTAWASHDARPGHDSAFTDAGKRAAEFASADLGASLSMARPSSATQWQRWSSDQAVVVATVTKVSVPDGAPAPSATSALARVLYKATVTPAQGKASSEDDQVAVQLERGTDGRWRVIALPFA
ncbi:hypothetical protein ACPC54_19265 [Kitasatospora sp. NPDC094028]